MLITCNDLCCSWFLKLSLVSHLILILPLTTSFWMTAAVVSILHVFWQISRPITERETIRWESLYRDHTRTKGDVGDGVSSQGLCKEKTNN